MKLLYIQPSIIGYDIDYSHLLGHSGTPPSSSDNLDIIDEDVDDDGSHDDDDGWGIQW